MTDKNRAIFDETLSDVESLLELYKRKARFVADPALMPDVLSRGLASFNAAIDTDAPRAIAEGQPAVSILKNVLQAIGSLYFENGKRVADAAPPLIKRESASDPQTKTPDSRDELLDKDIVTAVVHEEALGSTELDETEVITSRLDSAIAARKRRKLLTHGGREKAMKSSEPPERDSTSTLQDADKLGYMSPQDNTLHFTAPHASPPTSDQQPSPTRRSVRTYSSAHSPHRR
ncbi:uncharacterized protein K460DRAFT_124448 [Cucurbitaria berberidis CBS 394.84]|uniref:Uncharacterized protein n=1 Tax=Cucurbitaria berberidis CBS 394.84 TaxID=1168544 RepID=A0A9P4GJ58_9PLEO|nr:uncharacterized protein K460DRAFT_124448 [Cucurbitaria berberidis CBS 394.84]KAF1846419.1 hypothetical protein K460DRAFT_124448 [Cucurbitaria berberidis CBS 394.84]